MNFCPNCGAKNENPEATFCANCGFKFEEKSTEQSSRPSVATEPSRISWDDDDIQDAAPSSIPTQERPVFTEITGEHPVTNATKEKEPSSENLRSPREETSRARKSISAYDDDVAANEDVFIVPKGARASRPLNSTSRPERTVSNSLFEESTNFPDTFSEEEATSMFAASQEASENFAPFGDAGGDIETDDLVSSRVEEFKKQRLKQEQAAAERAAQGDLFADDSNDKQDDDDVQTYQRASRPQQARASRPQSVRASRPQQNNENVFEEESASRYSEPTRHMPAASPLFEDNDYEDSYDDYEDESDHSQKAKKSSGSGIVKILIPVFIILAIVVSFFIFKAVNTPEKAIEKFITAVEAKDITTLKKITRLDNIPTATDANWTALCNGLTQDDGITSLRAQLTFQITNPGDINNSFQAIRLVTKSTLGIFKTYKVAATGVSLTVPDAQTGTVLKLDDVSYTGVASTDPVGLKYSTIMPGVYNASLVGSNNATTQATTISLFTDRTWASVILPDSTVTPSDSGATTDGDSTASTATSSVPSSSEIDTILGSFYSSYLTCINDQSTSSLTNATDSMKSTVGELMQKSGNKSNTFEYVSAVCDASTISADSDSNPTKITVKATLSYKYTPRDGGTTDSGSNVKEIELVNVNGTWLVNSM